MRRESERGEKPLFEELESSSFPVKIRVGIDTGRRRCMERIRERGIPILVSANCLWDQSKGRFAVPRVFRGVDVALDSGGFVAMKRYGGYRWTVKQYAGLALAMRPSWWAQMDFCCEPEIAGNRKAVKERVARTIEHLVECETIAKGEGMPLPMPVLQGWKPEDYCQGRLFEGGAFWPELVGVGSVCRRQVAGRDGIMAVVAALDKEMPSHTRLHLFGVKSTVLAKLVQEFPHRVESMDSQAWSMSARKVAHQQGEKCDNSSRAEAMEEWYDKQLAMMSPTEAGGQEIFQFSSTNKPKERQL